MKIREIKAIIKKFEKSSLSSLELERNEFKLRLSKKNNKTEVFQLNENTEHDQIDNNLVSIKSPLVGTFYIAPNPESKPYIEIGQRVEKGDVVCLIEAMKIMNEITAPVAGIVKEVKIENANAVGYNQVLITIEEEQ
ncbi:MAG: biotin/lipoyl-containing protein [Acholeplasmataceae bacterium]